MTDAVNILKTKLSGKDFEKIFKIKNLELHEFLAEYIELLKPASVYVCDDSSEDSEYVRVKALETGEEKALKLRGHTVHFDAYGDQGRDKKNTKVLLERGGFGGENGVVSGDGSGLLGEQIDTGDRETCLKDVREIMNGIMDGKELIVRFFCLGPVGSKFSIPCVQLTDSFYVAHSEKLLYRLGYNEFVRQSEGASGKSNRFFRFIHSAGQVDPITKVSVNLGKRRIFIDRDYFTVFSVNTQYGGNTLGLKKLAMRLAIYLGSKEGWLNEHMLVMGVHGPKAKDGDLYKDSDGYRVTYFTGAFPSMCGKTSTAMMEGESIVGDDIAYLKIVEAGGGSVGGVRAEAEVRACNTERGMFGIIQGVNSKDDPQIYAKLHEDGAEIIFSNVLVTGEDWMDGNGDLHWIGKDGEVPEKGYNHSGEWFRGKKDTDMGSGGIGSGKEISCSHPNARFTLSLDGLRNVDPNLENPEGVVVGGIVYCGRDSDTWVPVEQAYNFEEGIILKGAAIESETTAATLGAEGVREFNPMSNLDFLSISIGDYVAENLKFGADVVARGGNVPMIFSVNYFLKGASGEFAGKFLTEKNDKKVWYKWMELRVNGDVDAIKTPTGYIPLYEDLARLFKEVLGKEFSRDLYDELFRFRVAENLKKLERLEKIYKEQVKNTPARVFEVFEEARRRILGREF